MLVCSSFRFISRTAFSKQHPNLEALVARGAARDMSAALSRQTQICFAFRAGAENMLSVGTLSLRFWGSVIISSARKDALDLIPHRLKPLIFAAAGIGVL